MRKMKNEKRVVNFSKEDFDLIKDYCDKNALSMSKWLAKIGIDKISNDDVKTQITMAIGEASMCWTPIPSGVFDSTRALEISERLYGIVRNKLCQKN